jgi:hypothetical protein
LGKVEIAPCHPAREFERDTPDIGLPSHCPLKPVGSTGDVIVGLQINDLP